jgi:hypothetical protein
MRAAASAVRFSSMDFRSASRPASFSQDAAAKVFNRWTLHPWQDPRLAMINARTR